MGSQSVEIVEVGPRDGLQAASVTLSPDQRSELVRRLCATGVRRMEAVSFVHPKIVPQMAGAEQVIAESAETAERAGVCLEGLVVNLRGYERAVDAGVKAVRYAYSVSDTFNRRNSGISTEDGEKAALELIQRGVQDGVRVEIVFGTAFGCPLTGPVPPAVVLAAFGRMVEAGAAEVIFADTVGVGVPTQVRAFAREAVGAGTTFGFHFHNTRSTGYANAWEAVAGGAHVLDSSIGGTGGCPFAPDASGNIATEDLVYMLDREGVETSVDPHALIDVAQWLRDTTELKLDGMLHRVSWYPPSADSDESAR